MPEKTYDLFKELSKEFCMDYGLTLKFLVDFYQGLIPSGVEHLEIEIDDLRKEIETMKEKKDEKKVATRVDGSKR